MRMSVSIAGDTVLMSVAVTMVVPMVMVVMVMMMMLVTGFVPRVCVLMLVGV